MIQFLRPQVYNLRKVKIAIAADHAGYQLKDSLKKLLDEMGVLYEDFGTSNGQSVDYPDFAKAVAEGVAGGKQMAKYGVYNEMDPPRRFVRTERFEGWDEYEALLTVELVERNGKTTMTQSFLFPTQELRDEVMKMGLTPQAMSAFYERLDALLAD